MEILMNLLLMLGGVGVFMHGMKLMSRGIEQSASVGVKNLFQRISKNKLVDYGVGIAVTGIIQSSSATSIMTIGLANAKIVSVKQGSGIILGAKVGTTLTAFIIALSGLSKGAFNIGAVFSATAFVGVIITFTTQNETWQKLALFLTGFGLLFLGLEVMGFSIGGKDSILSMEITKLFAYEAMQNPLFLVLLGTIFTCIIQSSSAAVGIFITLLATGVLSSIDQSFFLVMGANIGTCADGLIASFGSNVYGKRIAIFHVLTSTIGAVTFTIILVIFRSPIVNLFTNLIGDPTWSLAIFNLSYNLIYTSILLIALDPLVFLVEKIVKDSPETKRQMKFIDERLLTTPTVAVEHTLKEVHHLGALAKENLARAFESLVNEDMSQSKKIADDEYQIDYSTSELASYIIKVSATPISYANEKLMGGLHHVISDMERIGDHAVLFAKETNFMKQHDLHFEDVTKQEIKSIFEKITYMYELCLETFKTRKVQKLHEISVVHKEVLEQISIARDAHIMRLNGGEYTVEVSKSLYAVLLSLQRVADHLVNIGFSIRSNTGSKTEAFKVIQESEAKKKPTAIPKD